ncbi:MAG TPA: helix-turn-helix transcriptional regulator [Ktedonobacterales bacterium]|jgi:transcriptional regulator with XRE-family HTH domain
MPQQPQSGLDARRLRGVLAERRITRTQLAEASDLTPSYVSRVLCGQAPGELGRIKLERGLKALGVEREAAHAE